MLFRNLVLGVASLSMASIALSAQNPQQPPYIEVTGRATIYADPDTVTIYASVETRDRDLQKARAVNETETAKVFAFARNYGIPAQDTKTDYVDVAPKYESYNEPTVFEYYIVSMKLSFTLRELTKFEGLVTGLLEAGVNRIYSIDFSTKESRALADKARTAAIQAAHEKAIALAKVLHQSVGKALRIEERSCDSEYSNMGNSTMNYVEFKQSSDKAPFKQIAVCAAVSASFVLE